MGWDSLVVRLAYRGSQWSDAGEQAAMASLLERLPESRVLDLGVGAGRTTTFLADASSYVGVDSAAAMIADARRRFPLADLRVGDARELSGFADESFDLIVFSHNGIDCLPHKDRAPLLRECRRLLSPGGQLLFSTHNLDGPGYGERPSLDDARERLGRPGAAAKLEALATLAPRLLLARRNHRAHALPQPAGDDWACAPMRAHEFRFVIHFARLSQVRDDVVRAGLALEAIWTRSGERLPVNADHYDDHYAHFLCRRPE